MSRMAFLTRVFAFSQVVPPSLSSAGAGAARVLLDEIQVLERHEQLVVAGVAEFHELLLVLAGADADLLQADEPADAVVDVDDEVADLQVAEVRQERAVGRSAPFVRAALFLEQIAFGEQPQVRVRQMEAARQPAGRDEHGRAFEIVRVGDRARADVVVGEQFDRAFGAARRGRHKHDAIAFGPRRADLLHPVADAPVVRGRRPGGDVLDDSARPAAPKPSSGDGQSRVR